jgi:hypothetical protein
MAKFNLIPAGSLQAIAPVVYQLKPNTPECNPNSPFSRLCLVTSNLIRSGVLNLDRDSNPGGEVMSQVGAEF